MTNCRKENLSKTHNPLSFRPISMHKIQPSISVRLWSRYLRLWLSRKSCGWVCRIRSLRCTIVGFKGKDSSNSYCRKLFLCAIRRSMGGLVVVFCRMCSKNCFNFLRLLTKWRRSSGRVRWGSCRSWCSVRFVLWQVICRVSWIRVNVCWRWITRR